MTRRCADLIAALLVGSCAVTWGCAPAASDPAKSAAGMAPGPGGGWVIGDPAQHLDPQLDPSLLIRLYVYRVTVPFGTVSRNDGFWRRVDEQSTQVQSHELLGANGFRVGEAAVSEWPYFKEIVSRGPVIWQATEYSGIMAVDQMLQMTSEQDYQDIFYFDRNQYLTGSSYEHYENLFSLSFQAAPRKARTVRIALCPVVRSTQSQLVYTSLNNQGTVTAVKPEQLFDVNLTADIGPDRFLILAPSEDAQWPMRLGNRFLISGAKSEQMETILLFVPRSVDVGPSTVIQSIPVIPQSGLVVPGK